MNSLTTFRKIQAFQIGNDFSKVTKVVTVNYQDLLLNLKPNNVIVKNIYLGINASDVNFTNGKYIPDIKPPFDVGFEALGQIVAVGSNVSNDKMGLFVVYTQYGAFAEFVEISQRAIIPVPNDRPELLGLLTSGLTASIALTETGRMTQGETVLITAAAGGAGQIAVQLAKLAGNHVIGTCSSEDKVDMLKRLGCDRVINYKKEDFKTVMKKEYPRGVDIIFESVGGSFFDICLKSLAVRGRLIVIGTVSTYTDANGMAGDNVNTLKLLGTSRTVAGFFLPDYKDLHASHMAQLIHLVQEGKLNVFIDHEYQREFIEFALENDVLKFGSFKLKSGRVSPYFFNAGLFNSGKTLGAIGKFYAAALEDAGFKYDVLFGPAYKGIPLVCATALSLSTDYNKEAPFSFNRKEKKDHGEGGNIVGTPLRGQVVVVDDVITAGTAINESIEIIKQNNAQLTGVLVAVDRAEVAPDGSGKSAIQAVEEKNKVQVRAIISMDHIMEYMEEKGTFENELNLMKEYKAQYGIKKN
ncbi:orotate phosphoribosyltransferase [Cokeromyces recurvatus]|uniref:orotate phosphoribosyltransferase n=1 Tax=Cokeromyces recurvatus TaxID=90255 RepID=UPI00221E90D2|nr:orotate phosphoribosyltransferase [Cokeromyces recurvatus]KAI7905274.1 orotate phosphoribosyltransferase [Cokeromyces recurvatus]